MDTLRRCPLQAQKLASQDPKCIRAAPTRVFVAPDTSWMGKRAVMDKKEGGITFVLPAITSMCTYNVGGHRSV
jgi:hypothetical protein